MPIYFFVSKIKYNETFNLCSLEERIKMEEIKSYLTTIDKNVLSDNVIFRGVSKIIHTYGEDDCKISMESAIEMSVMRNNILFLFDQKSDGFLYFYSDQLDHLKKALDIAITERDKSRLNKTT